jgi:hypothetical protein
MLKNVNIKEKIILKENEKYSMSSQNLKEIIEMLEEGRSKIDVLKTIDWLIKFQLIKESKNKNYFVFYNPNEFLFIENEIIKVEKKKRRSLIKMFEPEGK